ncbi:MAG TPA: glycosyltransferase family 4 protein [Opitutaceae bacterium]|jgi:glycosyltransferase involved in cell wall biosynthesis|nr:glycosyltransferase family 4 protein [Opitutaceae bacterium]
MIAEGWTISWLTSHHAIRTKTAEELKERFGDSLEVHPYPFLKIPESGGKPVAWLRYQTHHWRLLNKALPRLVANAATDCIFLPWLDYCDRACGMLGLPKVDVPYAALHMHVAIHEPAAANASLMRRASRTITQKSMARLYNQRNLKRVAVIMETFATFAKASRMPGWEKVVYIPDAGSLGALPSRDSSRARFSINEKDVVILCFGALTRRKGVDILLKSAITAGDSASITVILAGRQDAEVRALVDVFQATGSSPIQLIVRDAFIDSDEERRLFACADIVWVGYPGFLGSSGVLIQAGCASLPVISGIHGETGNAVRRDKCGIACELTEPQEVAAGIRSLAANLELRLRLGKNGHARSQLHSPQIFAANILRLIEEAAGIPASPS